MIDKEIFKFAFDTKNFGFLKNYTHFSKSKKSICGDEMKIYLIIKNNKIKEFKYDLNACVYCQASLSLISKVSKNKSVKKVKIFIEKADTFFDNKNNSFIKDWKIFQKIMNKKNVSRKECLMLPLKTTLKAFNN